MMERQRAELVNRKNYWGVLNFDQANQIIFDIISSDKGRAGKRSGWFLWEYACSIIVDEKLHRHLIVVITFVHNNITKSGRSDCVMDCFEIKDYYDYLPHTDEHSVYIFQNERDGCYYPTLNFDHAKKREFVPCGVFDSATASVSTLREAIHIVRMTYNRFVFDCEAELLQIVKTTHDMRRRSELIPFAIAFRNQRCLPYSRFIGVCKNTKRSLPRVWSLQELCAFTVRNYLSRYGYGAKHYLSFAAAVALPRKIKDIISKAGALQISTTEEEV
jgi:hypothetical protein